MSALAFLSEYFKYLLSFALRAVLASVGLGMPRARPIVLATPRKPSLVPLRKSNRCLATANSTDLETTVNRFVAESCPSLKSDAGFKPAWWLNSGHLQTAYCVVGNFNKVDKVDYERRLLRLPDGGTVAVDITPPNHKTLDANAPTVVVAHGLTGGSHESYVRNVLEWVVRPKEQGGLGGRGVVANYRACAGAPLTSPQYYSAGYTGDYHTVVNYVHTRYPQSSLFGLGFSLGASVLARYMGEEGDKCLLTAGCVVGCPWNIPAMSHTLETGFLSQRIYSKAMAQNLIRVFKTHLPPTANPPSEIWDNPSAPVKDIRSVLAKLEAKGRHLRLKDVDEVLTAELGGLRQEKGGVFPFSGADAYYEWASSDKFITSVRRPLLGINALDDPVIDGESLPLEAVQSSSHVTLALVAGGGHLGFFDGPLSRKPFSDPKKTGYPQQRWVVKPISEFLQSAVDALEPEGDAENRGVPVHRKAEEGEDGWEWVADSEQDTYGRVGWKEVEHGESIKGAESSGVLQGL